MLKRKALSPLIATILLVAVSLSLAGILYSWSSQNFGDTTTNVSATSENWDYCKDVFISIDDCSYDSVSGFDGLLIRDSSKVIIDNNVVLTVIDANNTIASTEFNAVFTGNAMFLDSILNVNEDFIGLETPLKRVQVYVKNCPDKVSQITRCN